LEVLPSIKWDNAMPAITKARTKATAKKRPAARKWVASVTTDATHPPEGLFNKKASVIARSLASKKVSPKGPSSGMRMLTYYLNRGGKGLPKERQKELGKAKGILSGIIKREKEKASTTS
jgi:tRNA(adenine34) deaminase